MYEKLIQMINNLISRTEDGKIEWDSTSTKDQYVTSLSRYSIAVDLFEKTTNSDDFYKVSIINELGKIIESATSSDLAIESAESSGKLQLLYNLARRRAMGVDFALDKILAELDDLDIPF